MPMLIKLRTGTAFSPLEVKCFRRIFKQYKGTLIDDTQEYPNVQYSVPDKNGMVCIEAIIKARFVTTSRVTVFFMTPSEIPACWLCLGEWR
jgi:hypothetical protein